VESLFLLSSFLSLFNPLTYLAPQPEPTLYNPMLYPSFEANRLHIRNWSNWNSLCLSWHRRSLDFWGMWNQSYTEPAQSYLDAALTMNERFSRDYDKPGFALEDVLKRESGLEVREATILEKPFCTLLNFEKRGDRKDPKVLLVAPMSGHFSSLLRDTVKALIPEHDVYVTDWNDAREVSLEEGSFGFDDYVTYLIDFLENLGPDTHLVAVCQPTVAALVAASYLSMTKAAHRPASLTLMGGPIDVSAAATEVTRFAESRSMDWFRTQVIAKVPSKYEGAGRLVYPGFLQLSGFLSMNLGNHCRSQVELFHNLAGGEREKADKTSSFYDNYLAVCDLPAKFYLETVDRVFKKQSLARGTMTYRGELIDPSAITDIPLLTVEGEKDDISAPGQTLAAHRLCSGLPAELRFTHLQEGAGHYGIFSGSKWRTMIAPRLTHFIRLWSQDCDPAESTLPVEAMR